ncbi:DUF2982 domain-containing protein [Thalassotalea mangrovi]|uniref:DUF2982 domain-containing protein n=1 Tax=Thalassotalea mangrovi TaxID=2572245 RepID=A0A4V5NU59_9GAMM|nr:DUF2982 domain-containing protein [Thalassotalea mangrovi]TKB44768.1 DUF2982 domain-containing protein [Thalassotalea mangrovi]
MSEGKHPIHIKIRAINKRNGIFLTLLGSLLIIVLLGIGQFWWHEFKIQLIFLLMASFVVWFLGFLKIKEPTYSYELTQDGLTHHHRCGRWFVNWQNIQRVGEVKPDLLGPQHRLAYIGIKLKDLQMLAQTISPRLANRLLHEQKPLLVVALRHGQLKMPESVINFEPFKLNGVVYRGPLGAFLHRTQALQQAFGYHLYLADDTLDRDPDSFLQLLKASIKAEQSSLAGE